MTDTLFWLPRSRFPAFLERLRSRFQRVLAPRVVDDVIRYQPVESTRQLPRGISDAQTPGKYRLQRGDSPRYFQWAAAQQSLKPLAFSAHEPLWRVDRDATGRLGFTQTVPEVESTAVLGVRACDLAALALQDAHFLNGPVRDPHYAARRESLFLVAVHCAAPADSCFCAATGDGPQAEQGFDLALGELDAGYVVTVANPAAAELLEPLALEPASAEQLESVQDELSAAAYRQRAFPAPLNAGDLYQRVDHPRWQETAGRCLACGNCTAVCPSCFCHKEFDQPALSGRHSEHVREWDSCFSLDHSAMHGFQVRPETRQRYRQWLTHKLDGWLSQFGKSGCVGCGRCITWCPVGIDIRDEVVALMTEPSNA